MINALINAISNRLKGVDPSEKFFGIAETIVKESGSVKEQLPGVVSEDGEIKYVGIDDINSLMVYYKISSVTMTNLRNGVGDKLGDFRNVYTIGMYIYWDMWKIKKSVDEMLMMMQSKMPAGATGVNNAKNIIIVPTTANTNTFQIYTQEYASSDELRPLPENKKIILLNFNIEITFNPECFRPCPECAEK